MDQHLIDVCVDTIRHEKQAMFNTFQWRIQNYRKSMYGKIDRLDSRIKRLEGDLDTFRSNTRKRLNEIEQDQEHENTKRYKHMNTDKIFINLSAMKEQTATINTEPTYVALDNEQKEQLETYLANINSIDDIIKLNEIPSDEATLMKNDQKFRILYNTIEPLKELNEMIGLTSIKKEIFKHICYFACNLHTSCELRHILILGPSGCGKTELAKIVGKLYLQMGFLKNNKFNTYTKADLVAEYVGQTAPKTQKAIDESVDGVMFVDELYSLGNNGGLRSFDKECIDTITLNLSLKNFLFIGSGYAEDVDELFMKCNKGLARRMTIRYAISGYNENELYQMFQKKITQEGFTFHDNDHVKKQFDKSAKKIFKFFGGDINEFIRIIKDEYAVQCIKSVETVEKKLSNKLFDDCLEIMNSKRNKDSDMLFRMYT